MTTEEKREYEDRQKKKEEKRSRQLSVRWEQSCYSASSATYQAQTDRMQ